MRGHFYTKKGTLSALLLLIAFIATIPVTWAPDTPVITRTKSFSTGFWNAESKEATTYYRFYSNGSLIVENANGDLFVLAPPKFQPDIAYTVSIIEYGNFVYQYFALNGTDKKGNPQNLNLTVAFDFVRNPYAVKFAMYGNSTDADSEIEYEFENPRGLNIANTTTRYLIGGIFFDWADLVGATTFEFAANSLKVKFGAAFSLDPLIGTSTGGTTWTNQRKLFYANGRYWAFYCGSAGVSFNIMYRSSTDGETWTSENAASQYANVGIDFGMAQYGNYVDWIGYDFAVSDIEYRRGLCNADGSITWKTSFPMTRQLIGAGAVSSVNIAIDTLGRAYITYHKDSDYEMYVDRNNNVTGYWDGAAGYPQKWTAGSGAGEWESVIASLTGGKMYVAYTNTTNHFYGRLYNGTAWTSAEKIEATGTVAGLYMSITATGDDVHLTYRKDGAICYKKRTYGGSWDSTTYTFLESGSPVISHSLSDLYIFIAQTGGAIVYYHKHSGIWKSRSTFYTDTSLSITASFTGMDTNGSSSYLGFMWQSGGYVRFEKFYVIEPPEYDTTPAATGDTETGEPSTTTTTTTEEKEPVTIPRTAYFLLIGSIGVVGVVAVFRGGSKTTRRHPAREKRTPNTKYPPHTKEKSRVPNGR